MIDLRIFKFRVEVEFGPRRFTIWRMGHSLAIVTEYENGGTQVTAGDTNTDEVVINRKRFAKYIAVVMRELCAGGDGPTHTIIRGGFTSAYLTNRTCDDIPAGSRISFPRGVYTPAYTYCGILSSRKKYSWDMGETRDRDYSHDLFACPSSGQFCFLVVSRYQNKDIGKMSLHNLIAYNVHASYARRCGVETVKFRFWAKIPFFFPKSNKVCIISEWLYTLPLFSFASFWSPCGIFSGLKKSINN